MNMRYISEIEIQQKQNDVRREASHARMTFTISGIRQLFGNTFIAIGMRMHGYPGQPHQESVIQPASRPAHGV